MRSVNKHGKHNRSFYTGKRTIYTKHKWGFILQQKAYFSMTEQD